MQQYLKWLTLYFPDLCISLCIYNARPPSAHARLRTFKYVRCARVVFGRVKIAELMFSTMRATQAMKQGALDSVASVIRSDATRSEV